MNLKLVALIFIFPIAATAQWGSVISSVEVVSPLQLSVSPAQRKQDFLETQQMKTQGYILSNTTNAKYLLNIKKIAPQEIKLYQNCKNLHDTHLKNSISEIALAFPYNGIASISQKNIIGFAATGTFIKAGWTGVKEIFEINDLGVCSLNIENLQLIGIQIKIHSDRVSYAVNNKPTTMQVEGNPKSGFRYSIFWTTDKFDNNLDCSKKNYDPTLLQKMVVFANTIDRPV